MSVEYIDLVIEQKYSNMYKEFQELCSAEQCFGFCIPYKMDGPFKYKCFLEWCITPERYYKFVLNFMHQHSD